jgi:glycosyltransferase involved in cell wall biosynthesis
MIYFVFTKITGFSGQHNITLALLTLFREQKVSFKEIHLLPFRGKSVSGKLKILLFHYPRLALSAFTYFVKRKSRKVVISNFHQTTYSMLSFSLVMWPLLFLSGTRCTLILTLNGSIFYKWNPNGFKTRVFQFWLNRAQKIVVVGPKMAQFLNQKFGIAQDRIVQINNFTSVPSINKSWISEKHRKTQVIDITYLSLFVEKKGYEAFVNSIVELSKMNVRVPIRINFCGKFVRTEECSVHHTQRKLQSLIQELNEISSANPTITVRIFEHGISGADKDEILKDTHIFVLPTYYANEAQPIALIEAAANGAVLLTGTTGEIPYMFSKGSVCYLEHISEKEIAENLFQLIHDTDLRVRMSELSFQDIQNSYTFEGFKDSWSHLIGEVYSR